MKPIARLIPFLTLMTIATTTMAAPNLLPPEPLSTHGNQIVDASGKPVQS